jgi:glycerol-3-phosphate dehydrogenase (NAD(P)+)
MVTEGAGLVAASENEELARLIARTFIRAGVVCEESNDPLGVELAGAAKNAAALASGATEAQGLNAAGAAAGHIFAEVWRYAEARGARPESMIGLAGAGDLVATVLAPGSRNRRAGELLAQGVPAAQIPERIGQAVESLDLVPLLDRALAEAAVEAPVTRGLARLISGELPLDDWVALVRTAVPPRARWRPTVRRGFWARVRARWRAWRARFGSAPALERVAEPRRPHMPDAAEPRGPQVSDGAAAAAATDGAQPAQPHRAAEPDRLG